MKPLQELISLQGKAAIVTGGAKGIGQGIAYRLAEAGAAVLIADLDEAGAIAAAKTLTDKGWKAAGIAVDVSREEDIRHMIAACQQQFGSVDILVNNAGIYPITPIAQMTAADFEKVVRVNLLSAFLATKYAAESMRASKRGGRIINVTSIDALHPSMVGLAHYDASKHGMWGFTKNAALELAKDTILVNAIAPGSIDTPGTHTLRTGPDAVAASDALNSKIPLGRPGTPDEIGTVALFLASDLAAYMTGSQIVVDGGVLLK